MQPVTINAGMVMRAWYDISDAAIRRDDVRFLGRAYYNRHSLIAARLLSRRREEIDLGFFVPAATPRPVVMKLFDSTVKALQDQKFQELMAKDGTETPASKSPEEFAAFVREEARVTAKVIRESGAKFD